MSRNVKIQLYVVTLTDANWNPMESITDILVGVDGTFVIPKRFTELNESDFVFFASRSGAEGVTIQRPDGSFGRFKLNLETEGHECLEGEVHDEDGVVMECDTVVQEAIAPINPDGDRLVPQVRTNVGPMAHPAEPLGAPWEKRVSTWISNYLVFLHGGRFHGPQGENPRETILYTSGPNTLSVIHRKGIKHPGFSNNEDQNAYFKYYNRVFEELVTTGRKYPTRVAPDIDRKEFLRAGFTFIDG
jgi:hypothetical protein